MSKNTSIILGDHFDSFVREEIASGRYSSASEVIRNGLRLLEDEKSQSNLIKQLLSQGENSGKPKLYNHTRFLERMKAKYGDQ